MPFLLMRAFRSMVDTVHEGLAERGFPGIRAHHGFALQAIGSGCSSVQLGERLGVSKQAATKTARSLEELGLVERRDNWADRRERRLVITRRGKRLLALSAEGFRAEVARWRAEVGDEYVDATLATLASTARGGRADTDLSDWI